MIRRVADSLFASELDLGVGSDGLVNAEISWWVLENGCVTHLRAMFDGVAVRAGQRLEAGAQLHADE